MSIQIKKYLVNVKINLYGFNRRISRMNPNIILIIFFFISILAIYLEWRFNYPFGKYDGMVTCLIPPFIKRVRIYGKWIGFDKNWKFIFLRELDNK